MRKVVDVTISDEGRDKGKTFRITEMPADKAEKWAIRALMALAKNNAQLPDDVVGAGMAGLAFVGVQALSTLKFEEVEPLLDEMFQCLQMVPDPSGHPDIVRALVANDIEEVMTRVKLRSEVLTLHTGFSFDGGKSTSTSSPSQETAPKDSSSTPISRAQLGRSSVAAKRRS